MNEAAFVITALTGLITALGAIYIAVRQLPQIHKAVNTNYQAMEKKLDAALSKINELNAEALNKAEAREAPIATLDTTVVEVIATPEVAAVIHKPTEPRQE